MYELVVVKQEAVVETGGRTALIIDIILDGALRHVHIPAIALPNRMALYGLATEAEAIEACLKETVSRVLGLPGTEPERIDPPDTNVAIDGITLAEVENLRGSVSSAVFANIIRPHFERLKALERGLMQNYEEAQRRAERIAVAGGLRQDVTIRQGTEADLPPTPPRQPTAREKLLAAAEAANGVAELRQAIIDFARDV